MITETKSYYIRFNTWPRYLFVHVPINTRTFYTTHHTRSRLLFLHHRQQKMICIFNFILLCEDSYRASRYLKSIQSCLEPIRSKIGSMGPRQEEAEASTTRGLSQIHKVQRNDISTVRSSDQPKMDSPLPTGPHPDAKYDGHNDTKTR